MWNWIWGFGIFILVLAIIEETINFIWSRKVAQEDKQDPN